MNRIERRLSFLNTSLYTKLLETIESVNLLLGNYKVNFPTYTDHSIEHVSQVFYLASEILSPIELDSMNEDELYILACACFLHDVGMCVPEDKLKITYTGDDFNHYKTRYPDTSLEEYIRNIHHEISRDFILREWEELKIVNKKYAMAIALVAQGHRKVDLSDVRTYDPKFFVKNGREFVCLPYLSALIRIADELDVTNIRTPKLLTKYYMPNNKQSVIEWEKHIATTQINFSDDKVYFDVKCSDHSIYAALQDQFEKILNTINYCQKIIRGIPNLGRKFSLELKDIVPKYEFIGFDPKGIKYSFDVQNVITAFIGDDLYGDKLVAIREAVQNSIDSCRYKMSLCDSLYEPRIEVKIHDDRIIIEDNGIGMDDYIVENFFGRLGSSFYEQEKIKNTFEAIGQFGVGVFSYFLLGEYVDIETKTEKTNTLKFRIDKDPKNYFHFFDKSDRKNSGTTITIYFKNDSIGKYSGAEIEKYISNVFRYIGFPIIVSYDDVTFEVLTQSQQIDYKTDIVSKLSILKEDIESELKIFQVSLENSNFTGSCALVLYNNESNPFINCAGLFDLNDVESLRYRSSGSMIDFCQKGVFVSSYDSVVLNSVFGKIDLKKKLKINIDRNKFSDSKSIIDIVSDFEIEIIKNIYSTFFEPHDPKRRAEITTEFIVNKLNLIGRSTLKKYKETLTDILYFEVKYKKEILYLNLNTIKEKFERISAVLFWEEGINFPNEDNIPIIISKLPNIRYDINIFEYLLDYNSFVNYTSKDCSYYEFFRNDDSKNQILDILKTIKIDFIMNHFVFSNSKYITVPITKTSQDDYNKNIYNININHSFISRIISNKSKLNDNSNNIKILNIIFSSFYFMHYHNHRDMTLEDLNKLSAKLDIEFRYVFVEDDFYINLQ